MKKKVQKKNVLKMQSARTYTSASNFIVARINQCIGAVHCRRPRKLFWVIKKYYSKLLKKKNVSIMFTALVANDRGSAATRDPVSALATETYLRKGGGKVNQRKNKKEQMALLYWSSEAMARSDESLEKESARICHSVQLQIVKRKFRCYFEIKTKK